MFKDDFHSKNYIPTFRNSNIAHKTDFYKANHVNKRSIIFLLRRNQGTEKKKNHRSNAEMTKKQPIRPENRRSPLDKSALAG